MRVDLIASTTFHRWMAQKATDDQWTEPEFEGPGEEGDASLLSEFAGRECYAAWERRNPATVTNHGYLRNIIDQQHTSVLEHGTVSFRISDVSRSLTHELVRHRHFSYSQLSQRYVDVFPEFPVMAPFWRDADDAEADKIRKLIHKSWISAVHLYEGLVHAAEQRGASRKQARQSARYVLPNMTPTSLVMTGNHLAWRQMIVKRDSPQADTEIRELAQELLRQLRTLEPNLYQDFQLEDERRHQQRELGHAAY